MKLTWASTQIELKKILMRRKYSVLLIGLCALCFVCAFFTSGDIAAWGINMNVPAIPYVFLDTLTAVVLPLNIFMLAADVFSSEAADGTIKAVLLRPVSRLKIVLSKMFAIVLYVFIILMAALATTLMVKAASGGNTGFFNLCVAYTLSIVPMLVFVAMASFIALCFDHASVTVFCAVTVYVVMQGVALVSPQIGAMFFTSHINWYNLFLGLSIDTTHLVNTLLLFLSTISLFGVGGYVLFERKEF